MKPTRTHLAMLGGFALLLLFACWLWWPMPVSGPSDKMAGPGGAVLAVEGATAAQPAPRAASTAKAPDAEEPTRVLAPPSSTTGSLLVHVVWGDDKQPAAGIEVLLYRGGSDSLDEPRGCSDATGSMLFEALAPGKVYPSVQRGDDHWDDAVTIVAGQRAETTLELKFGLNAKGRVIDEHEAPVTGADIVVCGWTGGRTTTLGQSAADGTFLLRCLSNHCHIGARKAGKKPSSMRQFTTGEGATVEFTIVLDGEGSSLAGIVLDPKGLPVAGAIVRAGDREQNNHTLPDGAHAMGPQCEQVLTDAEGRFLFASVAPGRVSVVARARGLASWNGDVQATVGHREQLTIHLQAGAVLFGTVRDGAGAPLSKVHVEAGDWELMAQRSARSGDDGSYRLEALSAGKLEVHASDDRRGKTSASFELASGEERRWDPVLSAGLQLRGRTVDAEGKPVGKVMVEAMLEHWQRDDHWFGFANTDAEGRFALNNCVEGRTLRLAFRRNMFPEVVVDGFVPSATELVVTMPKEAWVYIEGTILGPGGEVLPNVHASPSIKENFGGTPAETADPKTGAFRYGPYPPGVYSLHLSADGFPAIRLTNHKLGPNEVWNLGTLHFQRGGVLAVQLVGDVELPEKADVSIYGPGGEYGDRFEISNGVGRSGPLAPGSYQLQVAVASLACASCPFEIRADRDTRVDVPVQVGVAATIEFTVAEGTKAPRSVVLVVRDAARAVVWRGSARSQGEGALRASVVLRPGEYSVDAEAGELRASGPIVIAAPGPCDTVLTLRRP